MMTIKDSIGVRIDREEVLRHLGYHAEHKVPARVLSLVDRHIQNAYQLIEPRHSYVFKNIERVEEAKVFLENITFESRTIAQLMRRCQKAAIFATTIGELLEEEVRQLAAKGRMLEAAVMDAVGSSAAENAATAVQDRVREIASRQGLGISLRFSPGYCDWDVAQQAMVFHAMRGQTAGIRLTGSCLMVPRKSVSGVIGMQPSSDLLTWSPCESCTRRNCTGRR